MSNVTPAPTRTVVRPTLGAEATLVAVLVALCIFALSFAWALTFQPWPESVAADRIKYLGWSLLLAIGGILLIVVALASPWMGTVKASGLGANLEIEGGKA